MNSAVLNQFKGFHLTDWSEEGGHEKEKVEWLVTLDSGIATVVLS